MERIVVCNPGVLIWRSKEYRCALGRGGITADKREGDGATPAGEFPLREIFFRVDRLSLETALAHRPLTPADGWCDAPENPEYNRLVQMPFSAHAESLWRDDHIYDVIVALGYNDAPPVPGKGSAIFMHVAREGYTPTEGCVALALPDLLEVLRSVSPDTGIQIDL